MSDNLKKQRAFNRFLGETIRGYILEAVELRRGKSGPWKRFFDKAEKSFNDIALTKYQKFMSEYTQPEEGADMNEFIANEFGQEKANRLNDLKKINYTKPTGTEHKMQDGNKYFTDLADRIVDFITNDTNEYKRFNNDATETNMLLTETYNKINNTKADDLTKVYELIQSSTNDKRARDLRHAETHLKNELRRNERKRKEELEVKDKEREEELKKRDEEHAKQRVRDAAKVKHHTKKEIERQMNYNDDELKDVKPIHEDYSEDSDNDIDIEDSEAINKRIVKYKEMDEAKNAAQQIDEKIKEDAIITRAAMDNDFYNQLDDGIKSALRPKIEEKKAIIERSKVIRYLLPKERPKWEKATMSKGVNPLLSRGAWGI